MCTQSYATFEPWQGLTSGACPVNYCMTIMKQAKETSCGQCVLCREGTWQVFEITKSIIEGKAESDDYTLLTDLLELIRDHAGCEMASSGAAICLEVIAQTHDEWDLHIRRKRCTNLVCKGSFTIYVDPSTCTGCGQCIAKCPEGAITGGRDLIHIIDPVKCSKTLACIFICPVGAIKKAGPLKPKVPETLVPVGSFGNAPGEGDGKRRRRRRE
ncbi:NADH-quinone oxidoreductase subunit F [Anoxynatronum buryatiense]|uniref:NADH-quinone oxidoreductase subunit F n=2 Tax=Anoxynatronum buryatiense TaxID=489973 RepID=A0AA46AHS1_9CLOT|nr:NADH-quinone oxidoreductase subunit F [Anoxynatronum buryatiense]